MYAFTTRILHIIIFSCWKFCAKSRQKSTTKYETLVFGTTDLDTRNATSIVFKELQLNSIEKTNLIYLTIRNYIILWTVAKFHSVIQYKECARCCSQIHFTLLLECNLDKRSPSAHGFSWIEDSIIRMGMVMIVFSRQYISIHPLSNDDYVVIRWCNSITKNGKLCTCGYILFFVLFFFFAFHLLHKQFIPMRLNCSENELN